MPLEDLLAFYGYEPTIPVMAGSSVDSSPSELADELPDMTLDKVSQNCFPLYYGLKVEISVTSTYISLSLDVTKQLCQFQHTIKSYCTSGGLGSDKFMVGL